jgi:alkyl hydroperoxide reductase subunit AhpC/predicted Ser/Thr protein kinase
MRNDETPAFVGRPAPEFELACTSASRHSRRVVRLSDYRDRWLILMFYPRDFSLVCPTELSAFSARHAEFAGLGAELLALSTDSIETHERWIAAPRAEGGLGPVSFPLASDPDGQTARAYGACLESRSIALRAIFIIDPNSIVQYQVIHNLNVGRRTDEILRVLTALQTGGLCAESWVPGHKTIDSDVLAPGHVVSHYRIEGTLGEGGFGTVYVAYDTVLDRKVALKIGKNQRGVTSSVQREARAAAALNHPNVCTVFGIDDSEGLVVIVMEYLTGQPLSKVIASRLFTPSEAAGLARQIAAGMTAAHAAGIVHGDLKPANIFLTDDGIVKILDFGVATRLRVAASNDGTASLCVDDCPSILGTPAYMSPERADGGPVSAASDVFAFGLILYELLTGRRALDGATFLHVLRQVRLLDAAVLAMSVAEPFRTLLPHMIAHDPAPRLTMQEVAEQLQPV